VHTSRTPYTFDGSDAYVSTSTTDAGNQLKHFCLSATPIAPWCSDGVGPHGVGLDTTEQGYFNPNRLPQWNSITLNPLQVPNATATNLVNYLRGHQTYEDQGSAGATDLFRERTALLGDIINAQPAYVRTSPFNYNDTGYQHFKLCTEGTTAVTCPSAQFSAPTIPRRPTVYIAANDGMLHAIETDVNNDPYYQTGGIPTGTTADDTYSGGNNAGNGVERWAYIPGIVLPKLYKLASIPYSHDYFVDGSPTGGDICLSTPCAGPPIGRVSSRSHPRRRSSHAISRPATSPATTTSRTFQPISTQRSRVLGFCARFQRSRDNAGRSSRAPKDFRTCLRPFSMRFARLLNRSSTASMPAPTAEGSVARRASINRRRFATNSARSPSSSRTETSFSSSSVPTASGAGAAGGGPARTGRSSRAAAFAVITGKSYQSWGGNARTDAAPPRFSCVIPSGGSSR